ADMGIPRGVEYQRRILSDVVCRGIRGLRHPDAARLVRVLEIAVVRVVVADVRVAGGVDLDRRGLADIAARVDRLGRGRGIREARPRAKRAHTERDKRRDGQSFGANELAGHVHAASWRRSRGIFWNCRRLWAQGSRLATCFWGLLPTRAA